MTAADHMPDLWRVHANPLFVKGVRMRLRIKPLVGWCVVTLTLVVFITASTYLAATERMGATPADGARAIMIPLLVIQGLILMLLGTGAIASGIARERDSGVFDYVRLTPLSPASKMIGYLYGLPVREYLLFALTVPFTVFAIIVGGISPFKAAHLYVVFFSSVTLYHLTGMVAGMTAQRPWRATAVSQGMVLVLYLFLPRLSALGFNTFEFLTVLPVFGAMIADEIDPGAQYVREYSQGVPFFTLRIHPTLYTLAIQGGLIFTFAVIVRRQWQQANRPVLGKAFAVGLLAGVQLLLLGNLWPQLRGGQFNAELVREMARRFGERGAGGALISVFTWALIGLALALVLVHLVAPDKAAYLRGLRRARKLQLPRMALGHDTASATPVALALAAVLVVGYGLVLMPITGRGLLPENAPLVAAALPVSIAAFVLYAHAARELLGPRGFFMLGFGLWVVPLMIMLVMSISADTLVTPGLYIAAPSPPAFAYYISAWMFGIYHLDEASHLPALAGLSTVVNVGLAVVFIRALRRWQRRLRAAEQA